MMSTYERMPRGACNTRGAANRCRGLTCLAYYENGDAPHSPIGTFPAGSATFQFLSAITSYQ